MSKRLCAALSAAVGSILCAGTAHAVSDVYAFDLRPLPNPGGRLLRFPVNAPAQTAVATNLTYDTYAMDFNSLATTLYAVNVGAPVTFGTINTTSGAFTAIAPISGIPTADTVTGMSVDPTSETFYVSAGTNLYTLNPATAAATLVGGFGLGTTSINIDIAVDGNGNMYGHDIGTDSLLAINKATGVATTIGPTGYLANFAQGMDFDFETNTLYATVYTGGGTGVFATFNLATGAGTTIVSTTAWNAEMEMAIASPIPEPVSASLLAVAGLALTRRRR